MSKLLVAAFTLAMVRSASADYGDFGIDWSDRLSRDIMYDHILGPRSSGPSRHSEISTKVARRTAELEIQRTVDLVAKKAQESYLIRMPPPPPPPPAAKS